MTVHSRPRVAAVAVAGAVALTLAACGSRVPGGSNPDTAGAPQAAAPTGSSGSAGQGNTASDRGVTPSEVKVGVIVGKSSPLGPDTFSASLYGAQAYFDDLNARGGVHGRKVTLVVCDDKGTGTDNVKCARKLADRDRVFALAGTTAFNYEGAEHLNDEDVPDIGGQPVDNAYNKYPHIYSIYGGDGYPRDGKAAGYNGTLYGGTETYRWFKENRGTRKAGVVSYNVAPSQRYAASVAAGLRAEGYDVVEEQITLQFPNFDAAVLDMKSRGVDSVYDAMDDSGNVKLCRAMESHGLKVTAKVTTPQAWSSNTGSLYAQSPQCRNSIYATGNTVNYDDPGNQGAAAFRTAIQKYVPDKANKLSEWMFEGWASAQWLTDAMQSCGANVTRGCVEGFVNRKQPYDGHGILIPRTFVPEPSPPKMVRNCVSVAQWQDSANGGKGGWATRTPDPAKTCYEVPNLGYRAG